MNDANLLNRPSAASRTLTLADLDPIALARACYRMGMDRPDEAPGGCLIWRGSRTADGYGTVRVGRRIVYVHRLAWLIERGSLSLDREIHHACGYRGCHCVDHLREITGPENMAESSIALGKNEPPFFTDA